MKPKATVADFSKRLNECLDETNVPAKGKGRQGYVAKQFGVSQAAARKWLEAVSYPETPRVIELCDAYDICVEWLLTGRGPKRPAAIADPEHTLSDIARRYKAAPKDAQVLIDLALGRQPGNGFPDQAARSLSRMLEGVRDLIHDRLPQ